MSHPLVGVGHGFDPRGAGDVTKGRTSMQTHWQLDPERSSIEFHVRNFYGLMTVKGTFAAYDGTLELGGHPAVALTIDAASVDTGHAKRDKHLRSADFFDVEHHPHVRFASSSATVEGDRLKVRGSLEAAGGQVPLELDATLRGDDGALQVEAVASVDQRRLGMSWSPLGMVRAPARLVVRGRLTPAT
jgi:polyisoprenoid-binding protein YceI